MRVVRVLLALLSAAFVFGASAVPSARADNTFNVSLTTVPSGVVSIGTPVQAVVVVTDTQGQPAPGMSVVVDGSPLWWWGIPCTTDSAGKCVVTLDSPTAEQMIGFGTNGFWVKAWVDVNGDGLFEDEPTTDYSLIVWQPDVQAVSVTASSDSIPVVCADGSCSVSLTATALDGEGNPLPAVSLAWEGGWNLGGGVANSLGQVTTTQFPLPLPTTLSIRACVDRNANLTVDPGETLCSTPVSIVTTLPPSTPGAVTARGVAANDSGPAGFALQLKATSNGTHIYGGCLFVQTKPHHQLRCDTITALTRISDTYTVVMGTGILDGTACQFRFDFFEQDEGYAIPVAVNTSDGTQFYSGGFMNGRSGQVTITP